MTTIPWTYGIIRWVPAFDHAQFAIAKSQGILISSLESVILSVDRKKAIFTWNGDTPPIFSGLLLGSGDHDWIIQYLSDNQADWVPVEPEPEPRRTLLKNLLFRPERLATSQQPAEQKTQAIQKPSEKAQCKDQPEPAKPDAKPLAPVPVRKSKMVPAWVVFVLTVIGVALYYLLR